MKQGRAVIVSEMKPEELRKLRIRARMSRDALATLVGHHAATIGRKERGETEITVSEAHHFRCVLARRCPCQKREDAR